MLSDAELRSCATDYVARRYGPDMDPVLRLNVDSPPGALFSAKHRDSELVLVGGVAEFFVHRHDGHIRQFDPGDLFGGYNKPPGDAEDQRLVKIYLDWVLQYSLGPGRAEIL
jgi:hypothetical protein